MRQEPKPAPEGDLVENPRPGPADVDAPTDPDHVDPVPQDVDLDD